MLTNNIKIFIVDDHYLIVQGLSTLLMNEPGFEVSCFTTNPTEVMQLLEQHPADVLLTDISMPQLSGAQLTAMVRKKHPDIRIIALSMLNEPQVVRQMISAGVSGYLLKDTTKAELLTAITSVANGNTHFLPGVQPKDTEKNGEEVFTVREVEILKLIVQEFNNKQIGQKLYISERTVETHRRNILKKSKVGNTIGLVKYAYDHKII